MYASEKSIIDNFIIEGLRKKIPYNVILNTITRGGTEVPSEYYTPSIQEDFEKKVKVNDSSSTTSPSPVTNSSSKYTPSMIEAATNANAGIVKDSVDTSINNWNNITGNYGLDQAGAWLGGRDPKTGYASSGILPVAYNVGSSAVKTYAAYQGLQEAKKMNEFNMEAKKEALARQRIDQWNKIVQMRRYQQLALGSGNSMYNTVAAVTNNPYRTYGYFTR